MIAKVAKPRGGARPGAGRPHGSTKPANQIRSSTLPVRLTEAEYAKAKQIGDGNASRGIRVALAAHKAEQPPHEDSDIAQADEQN